MTLAKARIVNYDCNSSFIVLATVITIINYDHKTFIVQATCPVSQSLSMDLLVVVVVELLIFGVLVVNRFQGRIVIKIERGRITKSSQTDETQQSFKNHFPLLFFDDILGKIWFQKNCNNSVGVSHFIPLIFIPFLKFEHFSYSIWWWIYVACMVIYESR